jgi:hypothetical protein
MGSLKEEDLKWELGKALRLLRDVLQCRQHVCPQCREGINKFLEERASKKDTLLAGSLKKGIGSLKVVSSPYIPEDVVVVNTITFGQLKGEE